MDNFFNKAAGASSNRKFSNQPKVARFSPSYGVRHGFIKDPNWPPAQFPEEGNAAQRRFRRMPANFEVRIGGGAAVAVSGNVSAGGVMFRLASALVSEQIEVNCGGERAQAEVIAAESDGGQFMYRAHFLDASEAAAVWVALVKAAD